MSTNITIDQRLDAIHENRGIVAAYNTGNQINNYYANESQVQSDADKKAKCQDAILLTDPSLDREHIRSLKGDRAKGTCEWIRDNQLYRSWLQDGPPLLWISGGPGKGKTMISLFLTEELEQRENAEVLFFFCSDQDNKRNNAVGILRGWIYQILKKRPDMMKHIPPDIGEQKRSEIVLSSLDALWAIFQKVLQDPELGTLYCVLDALDECLEESRWLLIQKLVGTLSEDRTKCSAKPHELRLVILSRDIPGLQRAARIQLDHDVEAAVSGDIRRFISSAMDGLSADATIRTHIMDVLQEQSEGTFLWVGFVMRELSQKTTSVEILETLHQMPKGLPAIYERILLSIGEGQIEAYLRMLHWVTLALRPLELAEVASIVFGAKQPELVTQEEFIRHHIAKCGPILQVRGQQVNLIHQSAKDYLLRETPDSNGKLERFRIEPDKVHCELAKACLDYIENSPVETSALFRPEYEDFMFEMAKERKSKKLNIDEAEMGFYDKEDRENFRKWYEAKEREAKKRKSGKLYTNEDDTMLPVLFNSEDSRKWRELPDSQERIKKEISEKYPFFFYAVEYWPKHASLSSYRAGEIKCFSPALFQKNSALLKKWRDACTHFAGLEKFTYLHVAAEFGIWPWVQDYLSQNSNRFKLRAAWPVDYVFVKAVESGHKDMVDLLLKHGADVNTINKRGDSVLYSAYYYEHTVIMQLLLDQGAKLTADIFEQLILDAQARKDWPVLRVLIDHFKRKGNAKKIGPLLYLATISALGDDDDPMVRFLVESGADLVYTPRKRKQWVPALATAVKRGKTLLNHGSDVSAIMDNGASDCEWYSLLIKASCDDNLSIMKFLLDYGADIDFYGRDGLTALDMAVVCGRRQIAMFLLEKGAKSQRALHYAVGRGNMNMVELLLVYGFKKDQKAEMDGEMLTPSEWGNREDSDSEYFGGYWKSEYVRKSQDSERVRGAVRFMENFAVEREA